MDLALLILRVVVGLLVASHGAMKLFGAFGGPGLHGTSGWLHSIGLRPGRLWAWFASASEFGGGLLFALGLLSPLGAVGIASAMLMAITKAHWPRLWAMQNGMEYPLVNLAVAVATGIAGPGAFSLDAWLGLSVPPAVTLVVVTLAALGYLTGVVTSASAAVPSKAEDNTQPAA